jgi:hypothetical protein
MVNNPNNPTKKRSYSSKYVRSDTHKLNIARALHGRHQTPTTRERISLAMQGHKVSNKTKSLMRLRAEERKSLFATLANHINKEHPNHPIILSIRKKYLSCPVCNDLLANQPKSRPMGVKVGMLSQQPKSGPKSSAKNS